MAAMCLFILNQFDICIMDFGLIYIDIHSFSKLNKYNLS